jgi:hypothetical protein
VDVRVFRTETIHPVWAFQDEVADGFEYVVQSINCYGCGHYVTYQLVDGRWYLIDDARVEALPSYEAVVDRTSRNLCVCLVASPATFPPLAFINLLAIAGMCR